MVLSTRSASCYQLFVVISSLSVVDIPIDDTRYGICWNGLLETWRDSRMPDKRKNRNYFKTRLSDVVKQFTDVTKRLNNGEDV